MRKNCYLRASRVKIRTSPLDLATQRKSAIFFISGLFDLMTVNACDMLHSALGHGIIFTKFEVGSTCLFLTYNVFTVYMLRPRCDLDL